MDRRGKAYSSGDKEATEMPTTAIPAEAEAKILVAGTGPAGLIAALSFAGAGFAVTLIGPEPNIEDGRTTALMNPALETLERIGVLAALADQAAPLEIMRIVDATERLIRSAPATFHARDIGEERFGLNIPNKVLVAALARAVAANASIAWKKTLVEDWQPGSDMAIARLADGSEISGKLVVAADGRMSPAREAAGISVSSHPFPQAALILNFTHTLDHNFTSTELHTQTGPFTQVPLPGGRRSSLVCVVRPETASELAALDDDALSLHMERRMQSMLGRVTVEPKRQIYPLSTSTPKRFARNRVALVGEAAHVFPPIGAQGLNLGIRDIVDLVDVSSENRSDPGSAKAMTAYDLRRRPDILARTSAVDLLNRSLLSNMLPAQIARSAALGLLGRFAPLRAFFMREGLHPGSGFSALGNALREQLQR